MKCKEYKDAIAKNLKGIRRSGDMEALYQHSEILFGFAHGEFDQRNFDMACILRILLNRDLTEKQIHNIYCFMRAYTA